MTFTSPLLRLAMLLTVCLAATVSGQGALADDASEGWRGQITVYGWAAGVHGDVRPFRRAPELSFDASFSEILEDLDAAFFVTGLARRGRLVLFADFSYASSSRAGSIAPGVPASGEVSQHALTLAAGGRAIAEPGLSLDILGGLRGWSLDTRVDVPRAGVSASRDKTFVDPIIAIRVNRRIAPGWTLLGYADIGGAGVGSDLTYQITGTANWRATETVFLSAGYRHLFVDHDEGGTSFRGAMTGPLLGATWRF